MSTTAIVVIVVLATLVFVLILLALFLAYAVGAYHKAYYEQGQLMNKAVAELERTNADLKEYYDFVESLKAKGIIQQVQPKIEVAN